MLHMVAGVLRKRAVRPGRRVPALAGGGGDGGGDGGGGEGCGDKGGGGEGGGGEGQ